MEPPFYSVEIMDVGGETIDTCWNPIAINAARSFNNAGAATIEIPRDWERAIFRQNTRFKLWRTGYDYKRRSLGDTVWFLQDFHNQVSSDKYVIECDDAFAIGGKRVIAYTGETMYADKTLESFEIGGGFTEYFHIDNLMKEYVRENFGPASLDPDRINPFVSIFEENNFAPFGEQQAGFAELGSTLTGLANMSAQLGMELYYDFVPQENGTFQFKIWRNVRGVDRGQNSIEPLILSDSSGALDEVIISDLYRDSRTVCYVLGEGSGAAQVYKKIEDTTRVNEHPFARTEFTHNASEISNEEVLTFYGQSALYARRPRRVASARIVDNTSFRYDEHATYGDRIVMQAEEEAFDVQISAFSMTYGEQGEALDIRLSGSRPL